MRVIDTDAMPWVNKVPADFAENHICSGCHAYVELKIDDVENVRVRKDKMLFEWSWQCSLCGHRSGVVDDDKHVTLAKDAQKRSTRKGRHRKQ